MIKVSVIPVSTATTMELLVEVEENVCKPYCVSSSVQPVTTMSYTAGTATILNGNAVIPLTAVVSVMTPDTCGCGCAHTQVFSETVNVAFNSSDTNLVTVTPGTSTISSPTNIKCGKARGVKVIGTATIAIS